MNFFVKEVFADEGICNPLIKGLCGGSEKAGNQFASLVSALLALFLFVGSLFTLINLFQGGLSWITSGGDKTALEASRSRIQNAILGMLIVAASWVIFIFFTQFLGISPLGSNNFQISLPSLFGQ